MNTVAKLGFAFVAGGIVTLLSSAGASQPESVLNGKVFSVSISEIVKMHAQYDDFTGSYRKIITTMDGKNRVIELTPVVHRGKQLIRVVDNNFVSYMPLSGTVLNGQILIQTFDVAAQDARLKAEGW